VLCTLTHGPTSTAMSGYQSGSVNPQRVCLVVVVGQHAVYSQGFDGNVAAAKADFHRDVQLSVGHGPLCSDSLSTRVAA
jgi:hypothetical protein